MLTGRPAEEMPGSTGDLLPELLQLHERVRQAMTVSFRPYGRPSPYPRVLEGLRREASGSTTALPFVEDIGLPSRRQGGLGHGEDAVCEG